MPTPRAMFALSLCIAQLAWAGTTGKIAGTVTDSKTGERLASVNVVVQGTTLGASTNIEGDYVILNVPPGRHTITVTYIGYKKYQLRDLLVSVDFTTRLDIPLEEGSVELDAIVVRGERSPLIRQDLTNPVASISSESIDALPVTDVSEVIGLQAGVVVANDGSLHIRGGLGNEILYTLNGVNINDPYGNNRTVGIATNAVQEVSVSSGTFNAEYGSALSGVVNYVTKEGSARWTGSLKYLTGDHVSNHSDVFFNIDDFKPTNIYRFEGSLGGPVIGDDISFFASGVYSYFGGSIYGQRVYRPEDSYLSRNEFPQTDPRWQNSGTGPYYFGPALFDTTNALFQVGDTGRWRPGDGDIVPLNWSRGYNIQANVTYRIAPQMKLKYEFVHDFSDGPGGGPYSSAFSNRFKPDGRTFSQGKGYFHAVELTHTLNERMFYTLKGSYIIDKGITRAFNAPDDERYVPSFYLRYFTNTDYLTGGTDPYRFYRKTQTTAGKFDMVAQLFANHEVKLGFELRKHTLYVDSYTLLFQDPNDPTATPTFTNMLVKGNVFRPKIPTVDEGRNEYTRKPLQIATYIQDKIELFRSIILNLGLRYEYFDPAAQYNDRLTEEYQQEEGALFLKKNLTDASPKHMLSPRFSVSYPITDRGAIRFSYGHFYQIGSLASLYTNPEFRSPRGTPTFGNADVNPQKSIQYELGLQQGLTDNLRLEISAYYKDVSNYIYFQRIITPRGDKDYSLLTNLNYANTRGVSISLFKQRFADDLLSATLDYTFQIAEGNRTLPTEEIFFNEQQGRLSETYLVPFSFDRSHTITSTVTLSQPNDWTVALIGYVRTGTPYTPEFPSNISPITFTQNSDRQPVQWNIDLKAEKFFSLGPLQYSLFLQVDNLFDVQNELYVYANSGRALYNIDETSRPELLADLRQRVVRGDPNMIPLWAVDNYYQNPGNISSPRLVRIGASVLF